MSQDMVPHRQVIRRCVPINANMVFMSKDPRPALSDVVLLLSGQLPLNTHQSRVRYGCLV